MSEEKKIVNLGIESEDRREGAGGTPTGPNGGVVVTGVARFSSSAKAGVQVGDEIIAVDGKKVTSFADVTSLVDAAGVGATVAFAVKRGGESMDVKVRLFAKKTLKNFKVSKSAVVLERKIAP